jgi:hypothetical protein
VLGGFQYSWGKKHSNNPFKPNKKCLAVSNKRAYFWKGYKSGIRTADGIGTPPRVDVFGSIFSSIRQYGKFAWFSIAQPDLANGTRFQAQMKECLTLFHLHLESRAVRKILLRYREINQFISVLSQHDFRVITRQNLWRRFIEYFLPGRGWTLLGVCVGIRS